MTRLKENIKRMIFVLMFGIPLTIWLLLRNRRTVYFIPHIGLGDYCIALGYLESFKRANHIEHITLIVPANRMEVAQFYPCWDSLLLLKRPLYVGLVCFGAIPIGRTIHQKLRRIINISFGIRFDPKHFFDDHSVHIDGEMKKLLKLPKGEVRQGPTVPRTHIKGMAEKYGLRYGKTVLLNPYTSGMGVEEIDNNFYIKLAAGLRANGFTVATILGSEKQQPISGTQGIIATLAEAWYLLIWCGYVIGTRSGFFDFIRFSGCHIVGIYGPDYQLQHFYSLCMPDRNEPVREYVWHPEQEKELIDKILEDCLAWKA